MPKSRFVTNLRGGRPRAVDSPLGPLPERGLHTEQLDRVRDTVETGEKVVGARSFHGKGLAATADELQIAKTALRLRLLQCGKEIVEKPSFRVEVIDMALPGADTLADWLATLPETLPVADADVEAFEAQMHGEALPLLPAKSPVGEGFTFDQVALIDKIARGLRLGANGIAPFLRMTTSAMVVTRLKAMNLRLVGVYEYKLEAAQS